MHDDVTRALGPPRIAHGSDDANRGVAGDPGDRIARDAARPSVRLGPYELRGELGRGGMGRVLRAHDTRLDREVASTLSNLGFALDALGRA